MTVDNDEPPTPVRSTTSPLAQAGIVIEDQDRWDGSLTVEVNLQDLHLSWAYVESVISHVRPDFLEQWVAALLISHTGDFEEMITHIAPCVWVRGVSTNGHAVDVRLGRDPSRLVLHLHARHVAATLSARMQWLVGDTQVGSKGSDGGQDAMRE
jgi:hypothetical protein